MFTSLNLQHLHPRPVCLLEHVLSPHRSRHREGAGALPCLLSTNHVPPLAASSQWQKSSPSSGSQSACALTPDATDMQQESPKQQSEQLIKRSRNITTICSALKCNITTLGPLLYASEYTKRFIPLCGLCFDLAPLRWGRNYTRKNDVFFNEARFCQLSCFFLAFSSFKRNTKVALYGVIKTNIHAWRFAICTNWQLPHFQCHGFDIYIFFFLTFPLLLLTSYPAFNI